MSQRLRDSIPAEGDVAQPMVPFETAIMVAAMAIATILVPTGQGHSQFLNDSMILGFSGFILFLIAKVSLVSSGKMATWGPSPMSRPFKAAYAMGYLLMIAGTIGMMQLPR